MRQLFVSNAGSPALERMEEGEMLALVQCVGNSLATATIVPVPSDSRFVRIKVIATFVDVNNNAIVLASVGTNVGASVGIPLEYEIFANGPNGQSITVFLSSGAFVDGTTSVTIPCGGGKFIGMINQNFGGSPVWGKIG